MKLLQMLLALISKLNKIGGCTFVNVTYTNKEGEIQNTTFNVGVSYDNAKKKDIEYLKDLDVTKLKSSQGKQLLEEARQALLGALISPNKARSQGQKDAYKHLTNGLKIHKETNQLYVYGMKVKKTVLVEGDYKADTRRPLTIAKDDIRKGMKSTQYRNYELTSMAKVTLKGDTLIFA